MSNQIDITGGARVRGLNGVITGTTGVLNSLPINSPNGIPQLDVNGKILVSQLPNSVMEFLGTWDAATNTPTLADGIGNAGDVYLCNVAGTVNFGSGPITFNDGDYVVYSGSTWERSGGAMGTVTSVAASINGNAVGITGSPITTAGTLAFGFTGTDFQYINGGGNLTTFPTLITSIGLSMPTAFNVSNSPLTANGTIAVTGAGTASQYIRGDGQLATFPTTGGGGSAIYYYLNGSVNSTVTGYKQLSNTAIVGAGTDFDLVGNGLIAQFLTDVGNPNRILIPSGAWNFEVFFSSSSNGGNEKFYLELVKYNGSTFTTIASTVTNPEAITGGTTTDLYITSMAVPETTLLVTDRLAVRVYIVDNSGARTITLHTEDNNLCQITTTFSAGISSINGLTENTQYLAVGTSGMDFNINSLVDTHTFNLPSASATARGVITTGTQTIAGIKTFTSNINADAGIGIKHGTTVSQTGYTGLGANVNQLLIGLTGAMQTMQYPTAANYTYTFPTATGTLALTSDLTSFITLTSLSASSPLAYNNTTGAFSIQVANTSQNGYLSSTDWNTFNGKQNALTNPVTGTGTTNYVPKFTNTSAIGDSLIQSSTYAIGIGGGVASWDLNYRSINLYGINNYITGADNGTLYLGTNAYFNNGWKYSSANSANQISIESNITLKIALAGSTGSAISWITGLSVAAGTANVIIGGATDAGYKLDVNGTARVSGAILATSTSYTNLTLNGTNATGWGNNMAFQSGGTDFGYIGSIGSLLGSTTKDMTIWATAGNGFGVYTNGNNQRLYIASTGAATFSSSVTATNGIFSGEVYNTTTGAFFIANAIANTSYPTYGFYNNAGVGMYRPSADVLGFVTSSTERMRITSGGDLQFGNNNSVKQLINSTSGSYGQLQIGNSTSNSEASMSFISGASSLGGSPTSINGDNYIFGIGAGVYGIGGNSWGIGNKGFGNYIAKIAYNSTSWTFSSDFRLKDIIGNVNNVLDSVCALNPVYYSWKNDESKTKKIGLIAQEVYKLFPDLVDVPENEFDENGFPTYWGLNYGDITPILIKGMQEIVEKYDSKIAILSAQIEELKALINK